MLDLTFQLREWFLENTFAPPWLPRRIQHPITAFGFGLLVQGVAVLLTALLLQLDPNFSFRGALLILGVLVVAWTVGGGPGLFASFAGTAMLDYFLLPPYFSFTFDKNATLVTVGMYFVVCLATNFAGSHPNRPHPSFAKLWNEVEHVSARHHAQAPSLADLAQRVAETETYQRQLAEQLASQHHEVLATIAATRTELVEHIEQRVTASAPQQ